MRISDFIYLDNASTSFPKPKKMIEYMEKYINEIGINPGRGSSKLSKIGLDYILDVRKKLSYLFNIKNYSNIVFTSNATHSLNIVVKSFFNKGDHALICSYSHNSLIRPLNHLRNKGLINYDIFNVSDFGEVDLDELKNKINTKTKIIFCTHVSNVIGVCVDIKKISAIVKNYDLKFCLDITQSAILKDIDVTENDIDFLVGTGHKTLMGPSGIGFLYIKESNYLGYFMEGGSNGNSSISPIQPNLLPHKFEAGTMNFLGIAGLNGSLDYILEKDVKNIRCKGIYLTEYALKFLSEIEECKIYGCYDTTKKVPIISFNIKNIRCDEVNKKLEQEHNIILRNGLHCAPIIHNNLNTLPNGTIRLSLSHINEVYEIDKLIYALKAIIWSYKNEISKR